MSMLYLMLKASVLVGQLLALQEGSAVGWMIKESSSFSGRSEDFSHIYSIQTTSEASRTS
jgi:hypothetical protein